MGNNITDKDITNLLFDFTAELDLVDGAKYQMIADEYAVKLRSLLQPQPVNEEGMEAVKDFTQIGEKILDSIWEKLNAKLKENDLPELMLSINEQDELEEQINLFVSVSSEGKKEEEYRDGAPEFNPQNPHLGYKTSIHNATIVEQGEAKEPTDENLKEVAYFLWKEIGMEWQENGKTRWLEFWDKHKVNLCSLFRSSEVKEQEMEVWINVDERLPKDYDQVVVQTEDGTVSNMMYCDDVSEVGSWHCQHSYFKRNSFKKMGAILRWQPLRSLQVKSNEQTKTV